MSKQEHLRRNFYKLYQKEAEEYNKVFMKKYDEDLNTTLIFVSLAYRTDACPLSWTTGWPLFRRDLCIHYLGPFRIPARPERRDECPPPRHNPPSAVKFPPFRSGLVLHDQQSRSR